MSKVTPIRPEAMLKAVDSARQLRTGGEPPDNGGMEARIIKLETLAEKTGDRLAVIEKDIAIVKSQMHSFERTFASKEDLHKELHSMTWRIFGACAGLVAAVYFIAKYVAL